MTLKYLEGSVAEFPDAVSTRGQKHLRTLTDYVRQGGNAAILFLVQRDDCSVFSASAIDPTYVQLLHEASVAGVHILPYHCRLDPSAGTVSLLGRLPFVDTYVANSSGAVAAEKAPKKRKSAGGAAPATVKRKGT